MAAEPLAPAPQTETQVATHPHTDRNGQTLTQGASIALRFRKDCVSAHRALGSKLQLPGSVPGVRTTGVTSVNNCAVGRNRSPWTVSDDKGTPAVALGTLVHFNQAVHPIMARLTPSMRSLPNPAAGACTPRAHVRAQSMDTWAASCAWMRHAELKACFWPYFTKYHSRCVATKYRRGSYFNEFCPRKEQRPAASKAD